MVFPGEEEEEEYTNKKKSLHNFSFTDLKWGVQRNLRCAKIESDGGSPVVDQRLRRRSSPPELVEDRSREEGIKEDYEEEKTTTRSKKEGEVSPPWNLRKRRSAAPIRDSGGNNQRVRPTKFNLTLTKKEVEDDFVAMAAHGPSRRPKKRPRNVQRQIDSLYPARYFGRVTADIYDVTDAAENGKK
ncbi:hypothetical protein HA466_0218000 [Hirschfeldia incana]|nr:hypothetical protein HA466_0218000 [Hirschfeldia incana]